MIPSSVAYHKPASVQEALELMTKFGDDAKLLAGGHSLVPVMKLRLADPVNLIDISQLSELSGIKDNEKSVTIGAAVTHAEIGASDILAKHAPMFVQAANHIGDVQVRNFGTIGGSIAHADPAADWPAVLLASNCMVVIKSAERTREVDIDQFFQGLFMTAVGEDEIISAIRVPKTAFNANSNYVKFPQPASRFALVGCACAVDVNGGSVAEARVAFNGVSAKPFRDEAVEKALTGNALTTDNIATAANAAAEDVSVMSDHFASENYRKQMAKVFAKRALTGLV